MSCSLALIGAALAQAPASNAQFSLPPGFSVERPSELGGSLLSLTFAPDGAAYVGRESAGIVRLSDGDRDGLYERMEELAPELRAVQAMSIFDGALWACGLRDGNSGLWRVPLGGDGLRSAESERIFEFTDAGEHGPHAIVPGPDGAVYLMVGNHALFSDHEAHPSRLWVGDEGRLLEPYMDPNGHGTHVRFPGGYVARIDLAARTWHYVAVGLRNAYDMAFDEGGRLFTVDSDMEWDVGLPWYRPVRALLLLEGGDYGSRAGSSVIPEWCADTLPAHVDLGRGSPTGAVFGTRTHFPEPWRSALYSGDWSQGRILAVHTASVPPTSEDFVRLEGALPVTDVEVGPEGGLWFLTGGRGTQGGVFRVVHAERNTKGAARAAPLVRAHVGALQADARRLELGDLRQVVTRPADAFRSFDRTAWPLELRVVGALATAEDVAALSRSAQLEQRVASIFLLSLGAKAEGRGDVIGALALSNLDAVLAASAQRAELTLALLRGLELGCLRQGAPRSAELRTALARRLLALFPSEDERISRELGVLLSHLDVPEALAPLLAELAKSPQEPAIHYADCLHRFTQGWDLAKRRELLAWFAQSRDYTGGISLRGYLNAMRARFIEGLPEADCVALVGEDGLEAESMALLFARVPPSTASAAFPRFVQELDKLVPKSFGTTEQARKDTALRALVDVEIDGLPDLARRLARTEGDVLEAPWTLLARTPEERDYELWLGAIVSSSREKRDCARRALGAIARRPGDALEWRSLLDYARESGPSRGRELVRTLGAWCHGAGGPELAEEISDGAQFQAALASLEKWFAESFPRGPAPSSAESSPRWSEAAILAFLERSQGRPGSPELGRKVFESAACSGCHAVGRSPASDSKGFGPDLANVTGRLSRADLLAAIIAPSRAVSDQYRTYIALTNDERMLEGVLMRRDERGIAIAPVGHAAVEIAADELESLEPSPRSAMPEGVIETRTLEEVRDLFAYLAAGHGVAPETGWSPLFGTEGVPGWNGEASIWTLRGNTLFGRSNGISRSSYLLAPMPAADMLIEFDVFLPPGGNSGLCYRAERPASGEATDPSGAQADLGQAYWGSLYAADRGTLVTPDPKSLEAALDRSGWNHVLVRFQGEHHAMELNGLETYATKASFPAGTLFGFQVHQGKPMQVRFANARWRAP